MIDLFKKSKIKIDEVKRIPFFFKTSPIRIQFYLQMVGCCMITLLFKLLNALPEFFTDLTPNFNFSQARGLTPADFGEYNNQLSSFDRRV